MSTFRVVYKCGLCGRRMIQDIEALEAGKVFENRQQFMLHNCPMMDNVEGELGIALPVSLYPL